MRNLTTALAILPLLAIGLVLGALVGVALAVAAVIAMVRGRL